MIPKPKQCEYWFGDIVFLRVRDERYRGMITSVILLPTGIVYAITWEGAEVTNHYGFELSKVFVPDYGIDEHDEDAEDEDDKSD